MISLIMVIIFMFVIIVTVLIRIKKKKENEIIKKGVEVESIICRIESMYDTTYDHYDYTPYVRYIGDDGNEHEARLNVSCNFPYGRKIRIKYLPGKYDYAIFISQKIE